MPDRARPEALTARQAASAPAWSPALLAASARASSRAGRDATHHHPAPAVSTTNATTPASTAIIGRRSRARPALPRSRRGARAFRREDGGGGRRGMDPSRTGAGGRVAGGRPRTPIRTKLRIVESHAVGCNRLGCHGFGTPTPCPSACPKTRGRSTEPVAPEGLPAVPLGRLILNLMRMGVRGRPRATLNSSRIEYRPLQETKKKQRCGAGRLMIRVIAWHGRAASGLGSDRGIPSSRGECHGGRGS